MGTAASSEVLNTLISIGKLKRRVAVDGFGGGCGPKVMGSLGPEIGLSTLAVRGYRIVDTVTFGVAPCVPKY